MGNSIEKNLPLKEGVEREKQSAEGKEGREENEVSAKSKLDQLKAEIMTNKERKEAETILTKLWWTRKEASRNEEGGIKKEISNLRRPEAEKGILQSYTALDDTIKNSKDEPGIAGFLGKIMNGILNW